MTYCVSGRVGQFVRVVLSTVASKHDEPHDAAQSQGQLQGGEHHVARPAHTSRAAQDVLPHRTAVQNMSAPSGAQTTHVLNKGLILRKRSKIKDAASVIKPVKLSGCVPDSVSFCA